MANSDFVMVMNTRKYGQAPYRAAVLHGGPGAPGYMASVARELAQDFGVLEPLQTEKSISGQVAELKAQLQANSDCPVTIIGSSWGAVLALFIASQYGELVNKLILVGSAVFDAENSSKIEARRMSRLTVDQQRRLVCLKKELDKATVETQTKLMNEWGDLIFDADVYDPETKELEVTGADFDLHARVWAEFVALRDRPGYLKSEFSKIDRKVVVIHGEYDPHPIEGIRPFLESCIGDISFNILPHCGHYPWIEKRAKKRFFEILKTEIR